MDLTSEQLIDESDPIGGLEPVGPLGRPRQGQAGLALSVPGPGVRPRAGPARSTSRAGVLAARTTSCSTWACGDLVAVDAAALTVDIKRVPSDPHPTAIVPLGIFGTPQHRERLRDLGEWVAEHGIDADGPASGGARPPHRPAATGRPGGGGGPSRARARPTSRPHVGSPSSSIGPSSRSRAHRVPARRTQRRPDDRDAAPCRHAASGSPARVTRSSATCSGSLESSAADEEVEWSCGRSSTASHTSCYDDERVVRRQARRRRRQPARRRPREPRRRHVLAVGLAEDGRRCRRAVRRRGRPDLPRQRDRASPQRAEHSSCSATRNSSTSRCRASHPPGADRSALAHVLGDDATLAADRGLFLETHMAAASRAHALHVRGLLRRSARVRAAPRDPARRRRPIELRWRRAATDGCARASARTTNRPVEAEAVAELAHRLVRTVARPGSNRGA